MCRIKITHSSAPYFAICQVVSRPTIVEEGDEKMTAPDQWPDLSAISFEDRYALLCFVMTHRWPRACDILESCPALLEPWAPGFLRGFVAGVVLSEKDFSILCAHLFVLEMAQERGVKWVRAFLQRLSDGL